jgi:hypothetical protein
MANNKSTDSRATAEQILKGVGGDPASHTKPDDMIGAIVAVGYALLALHDEMRRTREQEKAESEGPTFKKYSALYTTEKSASK